MRSYDYINVGELYDDAYVPRVDGCSKRSAAVPQYSIEDEFNAVIQSMSSYYDIDFKECGIE